MTPLDEPAIFVTARALVEPSARRQYLTGICGGDPALLHRLAALVQVLDDDPDYLEGSLIVAADLESLGGGRIGRFTLLERMGEGGMGEVWKAEQQEPMHRIVAVKLIRRDRASPEMRVRFERERQHLALMEHPNIARLYDGGVTADDRPWLAMEFINGPSITAYCNEQHLSTDARLRLAAGVCHALAHAHQKGILHRDIKPSNVLIALGESTVPKVIDFGVAKAYQDLDPASVETRPGVLVGTPQYMSPELADGRSREVDTRSDIYSLGVLLYELIAGVKPFDEAKPQDGMGEMLRRIREETPPTPSAKLSRSESLSVIAANRSATPRQLTTQLRGELDWIVMKCLEKDPARRYSTVQDLSRDIERYLAHEPVEAGPPNRMYRVRKFVRRYRVPVMAGTAFVLALIAGIAGTTAGMIRASRAQTDLEAAYQAEQSANTLAMRRLAHLERSHQILGTVFENFNPRKEGPVGDSVRRLLVERLIKADEELQVESVGDLLTTASLRRRLGNTLLQMGQTEQAVQILKSVQASVNQHPSSSLSDRLGAQHDLANAYKLSGRLDLAMPHYEASLRDARLSLPTDSPDLITMIMNLATAYRASGRVDESQAMLEEVVIARTAQYGPTHADTLTAMSNLGNAWLDGKQTDRAIALFEQVINLRKEHLGLANPQTIASFATLGKAYSQAGRKADALRISEEGLQACRDHLDRDHPYTLGLQSNVASMYTKMGRIVDAVPIMEQLALTMERKKFTNEQAGSYVENLCVNLETLDRYAVAEPWRRKWIAVLKDRGDVESGHFAVCLARLAANLALQKKAKAAEELLRECLAHPALQEKDNWQNYLSRALAGAAFLALDRYDEAESLLRSGHEGLVRLEQSVPAHLQTTIVWSRDQIIDLFERSGRPGLADELRKASPLKP